MVPTVIPFACKSCSVVPFGKRDHGNEAMIMVPTVIPFAFFKSCSVVPCGEREHGNDLNAKGSTETRL
jgi:hypothetical protein